MSFYLLVLVKFILGFVFIIFYFNLSGKTQLSQMTPIDLIGNFILGGIIGGVIYTDSISLPRYTFVLLIGTLMMHLVNVIAKKFELFRSLALGNTIPFIKDGKLLMENFKSKRNKIDVINILSILHSRGIGSLQELDYAQLEPNGELTVKYRKDKEPSILLILDGDIKDYPSEMLDVDKEFIKAVLRKYSLALEDVFLAEYYDGKIMFALYDERKITVPFPDS